MHDFETIDRDWLRRRAAMKWGQVDPDVISLSVADLDFRMPASIKYAILEALEDEPAPYGPLAGDPDLLQAISRKLNQKNGIPATPQQCHLIPGTMFAIFLSCYHTLAPGDEAVIAPAPIYPHFMDNVRQAGGVPVHAPLRLDQDNQFDLDQVKKRIGPKTRLLMVCNPHNPTGKRLSENDLAGLAQLAVDHDLTVFADELYEDMVIDGPHVSLASLGPEIHDRTLTVFGFSKAFGIPGFRVAYITAGQALMEALAEKIHHIIVHTDTLAQAAAKAALTQGQPWLEELMPHLARMRDLGLERIGRIQGAWCAKPDAAPFLFPNFSRFGLSSENLVQHLHDRGRVAVQAGSNFGPHGEGHVRINVATAPSVLEEAFDRMEKALAEL
jgi:aspartate/methionine/tyrosine aminotransferase